jgi:hypothetical protein
VGVFSLRHTSRCTHNRVHKKNVSLENCIEFQLGEDIGRGTIWIVIVLGFIRSCK